MSAVPAVAWPPQPGGPRQRGDLHLVPAQGEDYRDPKCALTVMQERELCELYKTMPTRQLASHFHISRSTVWKILGRHGIDRRPRGGTKGEHKICESIRCQAIEAYAAGEELRSIGQRLGVSIHSVREWARSAGHPPRSPGHQARKHNSPEAFDAVTEAIVAVGQPARTRAVAKYLGWTSDRARETLLAMKAANVVRLAKPRSNPRCPMVWEFGETQTIEETEEIAGPRITHKSSLFAVPLVHAIVRLSERTGSSAVALLDGISSWKTDDAAARALYRWEHGERVGFHLADAVLVKLDLNWWDVWDEPDGPRPFTEEDAKRAEAYREAHLLFTGEEPWL
jgi:transposase